MPERTLLALAAMFTLWALPTNGNAQALIGRSNPIRGTASAPSGYGAPGAAPGYPVATPGYAVPGGYPGAPGGYGMPGYGAPGGYGTAESPAVAADPNRKLQAGDQLLLKIEQDREAAVALTVSQTGDVNVDPIPQSVRVAGLTLSAASSEIKRELEKDYYYSATVRLTLERAGAPQSAGTVTLSGYVNRVGAIPLMANRPTKLSEAILAAGGFRQWADDRKVKLTRVGRDGRAETRSCDVKAVLNEGKVDKDIVLQDGDQIFVPDTFFKP